MQRAAAREDAQAERMEGGISQILQDERGMQEKREEAEARGGSESLHAFGKGLHIVKI